MKLLSPASKNSSAPREPTEEVKIMRIMLIRVMMLIMRMMLIRVMMLMERNYCFKRSKWLAKRTHVGDEGGGGGDNEDDGDELVITF